MPGSAFGKPTTGLLDSLLQPIPRSDKPLDLTNSPALPTRKTTKPPHLTHHLGNNTLSLPPRELTATPTITRDSISPPPREPTITPTTRDVPNLPPRELNVTAPTITRDLISPPPREPTITCGVFGFLPGEAGRAAFGIGQSRGERGHLCLGLLANSSRVLERGLRCLLVLLGGRLVRGPRGRRMIG
jgi:hypothetical protein